MEKQTARFGEISFTQDDVITFDGGLIGFPFLREFVLVEHKEGHSFQWLQSLDDSCTAFLVVNPNAYLPDYAPEVSDQDAEELALSDHAEVVVFATVSIPPGRPDDMTLNLAAPLVVNTASRSAKQVVLDDDAYTIRHRVFPAAEKDEAIAA